MTIPPRSFLGIPSCRECFLHRCHNERRCRPLQVGCAGESGIPEPEASTLPVTQARGRGFASPRGRRRDGLDPGDSKTRPRAWRGSRTWRRSNGTLSNLHRGRSGKDPRPAPHRSREGLAAATTDVKWVEEANLHVTLQFLGEVGDRDLIAVCRAAQKAASAHAAFLLRSAASAASRTCDGRASSGPAS